GTCLRPLLLLRRRGWLGRGHLLRGIDRHLVRRVGHHHVRRIGHHHLGRVGCRSLRLLLLGLLTRAHRHEGEDHCETLHAGSSREMSSGAGVGGGKASGGAPGVRTAGLLPTGASLAGELWVPLSRPVGAEFQIDVEVGKQRVGSRRVRLAPPRRWTLYWIASSHTDVGLTERHEECLEVHRRNLDAALARLPAHPEFRWTAECGLQLISYVENRPAAAGEALARAIRDGKLGVSAVFAQALTGILDHETFARVLWPTGLFAREHGLGYQAAQLADVPGHPFTLPTLLAASGVRYLASGV